MYNKDPHSPAIIVEGKKCLYACLYEEVPSLKLTAHTQKWMVGRRFVSFWGKFGLFSGAKRLLVSGRVNN